MIKNDDKAYQALRAKMRECQVKHKEVAAATRISSTEFSMKINGRYPFTQDEMYDICAFLKIDINDLSKYFPDRTPEQRSYTRKRSD